MVFNIEINIGGTLEDPSFISAEVDSWKKRASNQSGRGAS